MKRAEQRAAGRGPTPPSKPKGGRARHSRSGHSRESRQARGLRRDTLAKTISRSGLGKDRGCQRVPPRRKSVHDVAREQGTAGMPNKQATQRATRAQGDGNRVAISRRNTTAEAATLGVDPEVWALVIDY